MGFLREVGKVINHDFHVARVEGLHKEGLDINQIALKMGFSVEEVHGMLREAAEKAPKPIDIYIVWNINPLGRAMVSMHQTEDGALADIPESLRKNKDEAKGVDANYLYDFELFVIEKQEIGA